MRIAILAFWLILPAAVWAESGAGRVIALAAPVTHADWEPRRAADGCTLAHEIPGYGRVRFIADYAGRLRFELDPWWRPTRSEALSVFAAPPPWRHEGSVRQLAEVRMEANSPVVSASGPVAERLLIELNEGMELRVRHPDWVDGSQSVDIRLVPVRFSPAAAVFRACVAELSSRLPAPIDTSALQALPRGP
jgi:hypothetical protein